METNSNANKNFMLNTRMLLLSVLHFLVTCRLPSFEVAITIGKNDFKRCEASSFNSTNTFRVIPFMTKLLAEEHFQRHCI